MTRLAPMSKLLKLTAPISALALGSACAVLVASCGGSGNSDLLSSATADQLNQALDAIEQMAADGACSDAADSADQVATQLEQQTDIDPELKSALVDGFQRLQVLASDPATCGAVTTQQTTTQETTTERRTTAEPTTTSKPPPTQPPTQPNTVTTPTQPTTTGTGGTGGTGGGPGL